MNDDETQNTEYKTCHRLHSVKVAAACDEKNSAVARSQSITVRTYQKWF